MRYVPKKFGGMIMDNTGQQQKKFFFKWSDMF